jgi:hypothetical protein
LSQHLPVERHRHQNRIIAIEEEAVLLCNCQRRRNFRPAWRSKIRPVSRQVVEAKSPFAKGLFAFRRQV